MLAQEDIKAYLIDIRRLHSPSTEQVRYRRLHAMYHRLEREELPDGRDSPMKRMSRPAADQRLIPVPAKTDLQALLAACATERRSPIDMDVEGDRAVVSVVGGA